VDLTRISRDLCTKVAKLRFGEPVRFVYNPLAYARASHEAYLARFGAGKKRVVLLGMNPGPFGMAQTGVPFGEVSLVRDWLGIHEKVGRPKSEHPKRPVLGFDCTRAEVSGARLWGFAKERFGAPERFFREHFVVNYCPLVFMEESGKNRTPDKLPEVERTPLFDACNEALRRTVELLEPELVVGVGAFAEKRAREVLGERVRVGSVLHPSPASPKANRGWAEAASAELAALGVRIPAARRG
jgi:single-strand selective monofunctional uracil DNA glycosylase